MCGGGGKVGWAVCSDGFDVAVQLHLQLCRSAAALNPGAHPTGATVQALLKQALPLLGVPWRAKVKLVLTTPSIVWLLVDNNNNNKRPLTPKSMPPASDEHAKLKT